MAPAVVETVQTPAEILAVELTETGRASRAGPALKGAFTRYLRALDPRGEPGAEAFDEMWQALRNALVCELQRRALWTSPPSYLGVYGWESWQEEERGPGRTESALEELLTDCYTFIFLKRLPRLQAQLELKPNVDGFVFLYLRNYLHDRQRHCDPLGFRIFKVLRTAVREAVARGELQVLGEDARIVNETLLAATAGEAPGRVSGADDLRPIVERWNDDLLPDLVTAGGTRHRLLLGGLRRRLLALEVEGVRVVRFKDLADTVKNDVRLRWAALYDTGEGESVPEAGGERARVVRLIEPARRPEEMDSFRKLTRCVADLLERLDESARTRHYLQTLWGFLCTYASGEGPEHLPSNRRLSGVLCIPRERFPGLWETLGRLMRSCQAALSGKRRRPSSPAGRRP